MTESLKQTPLHAAHLRLGARMVPFAGYEMPVQYAGLKIEHAAVREAVGLFDVSHMGEVELRGPRALEVADSILSQDVSALADGQAAYTVMCLENGGIIDDLVIYRESAERLLICLNAANREKDVAWLKKQNDGRAELEDISDGIAQIAVQGPKAEALLARISEAPFQALRSYRFLRGDVLGKEGLIARTGYTGEDGFELYLKAEDAEAVWEALMTEGRDLGVAACGLGARDSLRLECCFALYGNDIGEDTHPYEAGLGWVVKLNKASDFVGKEALVRLKAEGPSRKLTAFKVTGRGIARGDYPVRVNGEIAGKVTSGTQSPTLGEAIGLCYLPSSAAVVGQSFEIDIRGRPVAAEVAQRPFYKRP